MFIAHSINIYPELLSLIHIYKILQRWKDKNIRTLGDVRLQDAQHQKRKLEKAVSKADKPKSATPNRFNNFHQRDYDFAEYEKKLLNKPN